MDKILGILAGDGLASSRNDDDFTDRLQYRFTSMLLIVFAVVVTTNTYVGDPIKCWAPAHFSENWETYANHYCWVRNTYYLPFEQHIPKEHEDEQRHMITYYQWMPIILLVMALFFYLPVYFWRSMNARSGLDLNAVIETGEAFQVADKIESKNSNLEAITAQMDRYLTCLGRGKTRMTISIKSVAARTCCICCGRQRGNYLTVLYILTKLLYIANAILQLFALNIFMGHNFSAYGIDVISALLKGEAWVESYRFPRVTMCDFNVRRLGNVNRYTLQCVLPINLFNEKIFLFVWFWIVLVIALSCVSLVQWLLRAAFANDGRIFVKKHLEINGLLQSDADLKKFRDFMRYLKTDGVFVLRLLGHNTNGITVTDVAGKMFEKFKEKHSPNRELESREAEL